MNKNASINCFAEAMINMPERIENVSYEFLSKSKSGLCVVFPPAGEVRTTRKFTQLLSEEFEVMHIEGGYYGISPLDEQSDIERFSFGKASESILKIISQIDCTNLTIIGGSVGALHAMELRRLLGSRKNDLVLFTPALYKEGLLTPLHKILLESALKRKANVFDEQLFIRTLKKLNFGEYLGPIQEVVNKIGPASFLRCLKDIIYFTKDEEKEEVRSLLKNSLIILGKRDLLFTNLRDLDLCREGQIIYTNSNHSPMKEIPQKSFELVRNFVNKKLLTI